MKAKIIRSPFSWWIVAAVVLSISALLLLRPIPTVLATANSPVNSSLSSNVIHTGFADLVETVAPTVVSVKVERIALSESSNMMQEFFFNLPEDLRYSTFSTRGPPPVPVPLPTPCTSSPPHVPVPLPVPILRA